MSAPDSERPVNRTGLSMEEDPAQATRASLLSRLRQWDDREGWQRFFEQYWRLIYSFARKCGLNDAAAQDAVQEVMVSVAEAMPGFHYDRSRGSFKSWLLQVTRRRVIDRQRRRGMKVQQGEVPLDDETVPALVQEPEMEGLWDAEWEDHRQQRIVDRVREKVTPAQLQMFQLSVLRGWEPKRTAEALGVTTMQVYLARHRVGKLMKAAAIDLRREETAGGNFSGL